MPWRAATACVAGTAHLKSGLPCQDASLVRIQNAMLIGAIADGAGSSGKSDEGAQAAVRAVVASLAENSAAENLENSLRNACKTAGEALTRLAAERSMPLEDFACTLTAIVATRECLAALQVGDGQLVVRFGDQYELLFKPDRGEYCNETTFLTSPGVEAGIQVSVVHRTPLFVCAATDGIERISLHYADWSPHQGFYKPLEDFIAGIDDADRAAHDIEEFLRREKLDPYTDDDKSLLLAAWREGV